MIYYCNIRLPYRIRKGVGNISINILGHERKKIIMVAVGCTLDSSLIIVISLQRCGRRQIAEPLKYCLMHVIVFSLACVFSLFLFLIDWEFGLIPYNWYQSLGLGLSGSNGRGSRKSV